MAELNNKWTNDQSNNKINEGQMKEWTECGIKFYRLNKKSSVNIF